MNKIWCGNIRLRAVLIEPEHDKNWSIHFIGVNSESREQIKKTFFSAAKNIPIFLQGDNDDWMMIEFWTGNIDIIISTCKFFEEELMLEIKGL